MGTHTRPSANWNSMLVLQAKASTPSLMDPVRAPEPETLKLTPEKSVSSFRGIQENGFLWACSQLGTQEATQTARKCSLGLASPPFPGPGGR